MLLRGFALRLPRLDGACETFEEGEERPRRRWRGGKRGEGKRGEEEEEEEEAQQETEEKEAEDDDG